MMREMERCLSVHLGVALLDFLRYALRESGVSETDRGIERGVLLITWTSWTGVRARESEGKGEGEGKKLRERERELEREKDRDRERKMERERREYREHYLLDILQYDLR
jgi:hypothetical protein